MKRPSFKKTTEEELKDKYPDAYLHKIDKNRICLTDKQLKLILDKKDDDFNNIIVDLCEKELKKKKGKSSDFYDTSNLIDQAIKERKKMEEDKSKDKPKSNKLKNVTFKEEKGGSEEEDEKDDQKEEDEKEEDNGQTRLNNIERRLKKLEDRLENVEEAIKSGI